MKTGKVISAVALLLVIVTTLAALSCSKAESPAKSEVTTTQNSQENTDKETPKDPDFTAKGVIKEYDENENLTLARIEVSNDKGNVIKATVGHFDRGTLVFYTEEDFVYGENGKMLAITQNSYNPGRVLFAVAETLFTYDGEGRQITKTVKAFDKDKNLTKTTKYFYEYDDNGTPIESFFEYDKDGNLTNFGIPEN